MTDTEALAPVPAGAVITGDRVDLAMLGHDGVGTVLGVIHDTEMDIVLMLLARTGQPNRVRIVGRSQSLIPLIIEAGQ